MTNWYNRGLRDALDGVRAQHARATTDDIALLEGRYASAAYWQGYLHGIMRKGEAA